MRDQLDDLHLGVRSIDVLAPQPTMEQHPLALCKVVAKTESPRAQPVLAFSRRDFLTKTAA